MPLPNVVVFLADDLGIGDVGASGFATTRVQTPVVDKLAETGMRFTRFYAGSALCAPSRYSILTGNLVRRSGCSYDGCWSIGDPLALTPGQRTTGHLFAAAGYATGLVGKMHLGGGMYSWDGVTTFRRHREFNGGHDGSGVDLLRGIAQGRGVDGRLGFDYVFESGNGIQEPPYAYFENGVPVANIAFDASTRKWSWSAATAQPFLADEDACASCSGFLDRDPDRNGVPGSWCACGMWAQTPYAYAYWDSTKTGEVYMQAALNWLDASRDRPFYLHFCSQSAHVPHTPDTFFGDAVRNTQPTAHLDMVHEADKQLGALVDWLARAGKANDSLVLFTSDNGGVDESEGVGHRASGPLRGYKESVYEGGARVPLVVSWPGVVPPGVVCNQLATQVDLYATFVDLLGQDPRATQGMDSVSVLSVLRTCQNDAEPQHRHAVIGMRDFFVAYAHDGGKLVGNTKAAWNDQTLEFDYDDRRVVPSCA